MAKSIQEWIQEGEELHAAVVAELKDLDSQIAELEQRRSVKAAEVNQIAGIIGKPSAEGTRRVTAHVVDDNTVNTAGAASATIARALAGRGLAR